MRPRFGVASSDSVKIWWVKEFSVLNPNEDNRRTLLSIKHLCRQLGLRPPWGVLDE